MKNKVLKALILSAVITGTAAFMSGCGLLDDEFFEDLDDEDDYDDDEDDEDDDYCDDDDCYDDDYYCDEDYCDEDYDDDDYYEDDCEDGYCGINRGSSDFTPTDSKFAFGTATDLDGYTVYDDIFAEYDITVINIWGTFCGPCIGELPELAEWNDSLPDNVCIIGLVCDIEGEDDTDYIEEARYLLEDAGADYINLIPNNGFSKLLNSTEYVPTTIFVDSEGNQIGEAIVGADVEQYKDVVNDYLDSIY